MRVLSGCGSVSVRTVGWLVADGSVVDIAVTATQILVTVKVVPAKNQSSLIARFDIWAQ